ncbi:hypothetical protein M231_07267 [Tremella mesenterica]|uniref:FAD/NAD(P)-binding domain-containing protein n=1 Tax=Tremella mesenterica TaxID=5217 RepID=A0A4Q1B9M0_TREME|nr:hypothetical protein M231_07267 [Tremella mesenterica]
MSSLYSTPLGVASNIENDPGLSGQVKGMIENEKDERTRTVVVLGASYGGGWAASLLSEKLPIGWKVVVIDRNSHMNHIYTFPRFSIIPKHAPKGFIPYTNLLRPRLAPQPLSEPSSKTPPEDVQDYTNDIRLEEVDQKEGKDGHQDERIQGLITSLRPHEVTFIRRQPTLSTQDREGMGDWDGPEETIRFKYCIYALGSGMPDPVNVWSEHGLKGVPGEGELNADSLRHQGEKNESFPPDMLPSNGEAYQENSNELGMFSKEGSVKEAGKKDLGIGSKWGGVKWLEEKSKTFGKADTILVVGGGALGIQFATDLKDLYPQKRITLLHSRTRLLPLYPLRTHLAIIDALKRLGVEVVLGERVMTWPEDPEKLEGKKKRVMTDKGRVFEADIVLACTGTHPHVSFLAALSPSSISPLNSRIRVYPTLQVAKGPIRLSSESSTVVERLATLSLDAPSSSTLTVPSRTTPNTSSSAIDDAIQEGIHSTDQTELGGTNDKHIDATTQHHSNTPDLSHIFAIGDCADTGAIQAGHTAYWQADVAVRNILRLIQAEEKIEDIDSVELEKYVPGPRGIKVSLGMKEVVFAVGEEVTVSNDGAEDLKALSMWPLFGAEGLDVDS